MDKEIIEVPVLSAAIRNMGIPLSPVVKPNGFVFVSGLPPLDLETGKLVRGDIAHQTEIVLKNVQRALESAGSSLDKVVKVNLFAANSGFFNRINEVYGRFFPQRPKVKGQIEKPLRKEIIELTQQDTILWTIVCCGLVDLAAPIMPTLVAAARSDRTHLPGCRSLVGGSPCALSGRPVRRLQSPGRAASSGSRSWPWSRTLHC